MEEPWRRDTPDPDATEGRRSGLRGVAPEDWQGHDGECPYPCPICAGVGILRQLNPEIGEHLATAAKEFMLAAKAFLDSVAESSSKKETEPVERIPFD